MVCLNVRDNVEKAYCASFHDRRSIAQGDTAADELA